MGRVIACLLFTATAAHAACGVVSHSYVAPTTVVIKPVAPDVIIQPVLAYGLQYVGPVAPVVPTAPAGTVAPGQPMASKAELDALKAWLQGEFKALRGLTPPAAPATMPPAGAGPAPQAAPGKTPTAAEGLTILENKCAACHRKSNADREGGSFVLFGDDNKAVQLSGEEMIAVIRTIDRGRMPKVPNTKGITALTDAEATAITAYLHGQELRKSESLRSSSLYHVSSRTQPPATVRQRRIQR